jgi:hypothetical protein
MENSITEKPHRKQIIDIVHIDSTKFDVFKLNSDDAYVGLLAPKSIDESIQPIMNAGGSTIVVSNLVGNVFIGGVDDGIDSLKEYATTFDNDN